MCAIANTVTGALFGRNWCCHFSCLLVIILLLKSNSHKLSATNITDYYNAFVNLHLKQLRFHDFQPRIAKVLPLKQANVFKDNRDHRDHQDKQTRLFKFVKNSNNLDVALHFGVPFYKVPIQRSLSYIKTALQKICNLNALTITNTVIVLVAVASIAGILKLMTAALKIDATAAFELDDLDDYTEFIKARSHTANNLTTAPEQRYELDGLPANVSSCMQYFICSYLQRTAATIRQNTGEISTDAAKFIHAIFSTKYLNELLQDTLIHSAIKTANSAQNCDSVFYKCEWPNTSNWLWEFILRYLKIVHK